jgi:hypothetical protein
MLCEACERIRANPERDWPLSRMQENGITRTPIGSVITPLACVDCDGEWLRRESKSTRAVWWTLTGKEA